MILNKSNILSLYMGMRQNFHNRLELVQVEHATWFQNYFSKHPTEDNSLLDLIRCHLDLSTLKPKLYVHKELDALIVNECIEAFTESFQTEKLQEESSVSFLIWSAC